MIERKEGNIHLSGTGHDVCAELSAVVASVIEFVAKDCGDKFANKVVDDAIREGKESAREYGEPDRDSLIDNLTQSIKDGKINDVGAVAALAAVIAALDSKPNTKKEVKNDG